MPDSANPSSAASTTVGRPEVKGSIIRPLIAVITGRGLLDAVAARVSPETRVILREPPLFTAWIDVRNSIEIYQAVLEIVGADQLRAIGREAIAQGLMPLLRSTIERVLAVFGVSPASLFARLDRAAGGTSRGMLYRYVPIDETSGDFDLEIPALTDVPLGPFVSTGGALELIFELCKVRGTLSEPRMVPNGRNNRMRYRVTWRSSTRA
ncbi:MAG: hypothetical protein ABI193_02310 [Minicystis sp.]